MKTRRGLHIEDIKAQLRKKHGTLSALSTHWGMHPSSLSNILARPGQSVPIERKIADTLGLSPHEVWPDRFTANGEPISLRVDRSPTSPLAGSHRQKRSAA